MPHSDAGTVPINLLFITLSVAKFKRNPKESGKMPVSRFVLSKIDARPGISPSDGGILPDTRL